MKRVLTVRSIAIALLLCTLCVPSAVGQDNDRARLTLESGIQFYNSGDYKNALVDFDSVIQGYASSQYVDEALMWKARYFYDIEKDTPQARSIIERVIRELPGSDSAPDAYYYLGNILADSRTSMEELRDALANYERIERLYPDSEVADDALFQSGLILIDFQEYDNALAKLLRLLNDYPESDLLDRAQFEVGNCYYYLGNVRQAMVEYQQARTHYPESQVAEIALDRLTMLYRLHFAVKAVGGPLYRHDSNYKFPAQQRLDDPRYIRSIGNGIVLLADRGRDAVFGFDRGGAETMQTTMNNPTAAKSMPDGRIVAISDRKMRLGRDLPLTTSGQRPEPIRDVEAFCIGPLNRLYVWDAAKREIFIYGADEELVDTIRNDSLREIVDMEMNRFGVLYALDRRERRLNRFGADGRRTTVINRTVGRAELRDLTSLAVDSADHVYVLDRGLKRVFIFDRDMQPIGQFGFGAEVRDPISITVDDSGALYVLDRRERRILRYQ